jgi:hypothetical protein
MNAIFLSSPNKSLRQSALSRYTDAVENHAQAPQRRLFHFPGAFLLVTRAAKPSIFSSLQILDFDPSASHSFSSICALFEKHRGYTPKLPILELPPCSRVRFPERGSLQLILASPRPSTRTRHTHTPSIIRHAVRRSVSRSIFTCNKKAICPTLTETYLRLTTFSGYSLTRSSISQETDR